MSLTFVEICDRLKQIDEITLLEVLDINSEDIVERFIDRIEFKLDSFDIDFNDEEDMQDDN